MAIKDLHEEPFDESTISKLEIFEDYAEAWIPTFVMRGIPEIWIFDFFAGTGYDLNGVPGSPIRILKKILCQKGYLFQKNVKIKLYLNEFDYEKFEKLKFACEEFLDKNKSLRGCVAIIYSNGDFEEVFQKQLPNIKKYPSLVYLDQNGIKFLSVSYVLELEKASTTDFLYFVSSSYFWRFGERDEFQKHFDIDMNEAKKNPYQFVHRSVIQHLKNKLPTSTKLNLYPFSLKKGPNIHGIIFGATHPLAVDKFLSISWKKNKMNGEANFDIDQDCCKSQTDLFQTQRLTKIEAFKQDIKVLVESGKITTNCELLEYTYSQGHIAKHASDCLRELKKLGKITYDSKSPLVTYENVYKTHKILHYKVPE